ncbi:hypothetical protein E2C01_045022 [Portunus trituberculatus]|uniref:Uncharacterized protein n=1 Tax=Portunus trituberculatus TaxID=210409 RepID=A0A5B7FX53_PORTR|nr:hypothetical protein [Portunus trituberculatus]
MVLLPLYTLYSPSPIGPMCLPLPVVTLPLPSIQHDCLYPFLPNLHVCSLNLPQVALFCPSLTDCLGYLALQFAFFCVQLPCINSSVVHVTLILLLSLPLVLIVMLKTSANPPPYYTSSMYISSRAIINTPPSAFPLLSLLQSLYPFSLKFTWRSFLNFVSVIHTTPGPFSNI